MIVYTPPHILEPVTMLTPHKISSVHTHLCILFFSNCVSFTSCVYSLPVVLLPFGLTKKNSLNSPCLQFTPVFSESWTTIAENLVFAFASVGVSAEYSSDDIYENAYSVDLPLTRLTDQSPQSYGNLANEYATNARLIQHGWSHYAILTGSLDLIS